MKNNTLVIRQKTVQICTAVAVVLVGLLFAAVSVYSILQTCRFDSTNPSAENILFDNDSVITNIGLIALTVLGLLVLIRKNVHISKASTPLIVGVMVIVVTAMAITWVNTVKSLASGETQTMLNTARDAAQGKYDNFTNPYADEYSYFQFYPFQLGYVFFAEILFKIFGAESTEHLFQIINVISLDFAYVALVMITKRIFNRKAVTNMTAIALVVCFQPMFITTLTNGVMIGLALSLWAVFFTLKYMQEDKLQFAGLAVLLITLAVLIKYTYAVVLIALIIALLLHIIDKVKLISLAIIALMILCPIGLQMVLEQSYGAKSGAAINTRVTHTLYAYMGVTEEDTSPRYGGWFSFISVNTLRKNNLDEAAADKEANEAIKERRDQLKDEGRLVEFYTSKLLSEINEPSFQSIWVSQVHEHDFPEATEENPEPFPKLAKSVYTGGLSRLLDRWFNYYNMIIFIGFTAGMVWLIVRKKLTPGVAILPAAVFGGIMYHTICEAKSQFMLPFFVMLIPFAVYGILESIQALRKKTDFLFRENHAIDADEESAPAAAAQTE